MRACIETGSPLLNGREVRQTEARTPTLLPKAQYTMPEAADYIVARLDRENLKLPLDQPRMLAERLAKGMMVFRSDLESVLNTMINKFPHFSIGYRGTTIEAEPANLVAPACDISYKDLNSLNPLEIWMRDIGRYRLLTAQEEVYYGMMKDSWKDRAEKRKELIEKTGMGDLTARQDVPYDPDQLKNPISLSCAMSSVSLPGSETHQNKAAKTRSGGHEQAIITHKSQKTAIDYLIRHNLRLVISPAVKVAQNSGMDVMALIAEGSMSLMKAAYNFDYKKGNKFSTYAMWWVKQALTRAAQDQKQTIRIPVHVSELRGKIKGTP